MEEKTKIKIPWGLIFNITIISLTFFLIGYFIFSEGGLIDLLNSGLKISIKWICLAVFVHLLNILIDSLIIYLFVKHTTPEMTFGKALIAGMTGQFFCAVTPSASGGQPMQILVMSRMGIKGANATSALIQKFLVWQFTLAAYCIIAVVARFSFFSQFLNPAMWVFSIIGFSAQVGMIIVLLLASYCKAVTKKVVGGVLKLLAKFHIIKDLEKKQTGIFETLDSFHENNKELNKNKKLLIKVYSLTAVQMTAYFLVPYCIGRSFGIDFSIFDMLCAEAYVQMISSLVPLPGGSGAAEYCFSVFFGTYFTAETIKTAILLWRTITYYGTIAISAPFAWMRKKQELSDEAAEKASA